jgi:hypothetical protein
MNSFKKVSLIIAAALTSTMLVSPAANANPGTVTLTVGNSAAVGGTVVGTPVSLPVPADNSIDVSDALKISVTLVDTGTVVTALATNATIVPALATSSAPVTASSGSSTLSVSTGTGNSADFYVYTKSTSVGTVSITRAGTTTVYYVQGTAGALNSIALTAPASGAAGTVATLRVAGYDVFGNLKGGSTINTLVSSSGVAIATALTTDTATATLGTKDQAITLPASGSVTVTAYATVATAVTGLAAPVGSVVAVVAVRDLAGELATRTSELAVANAALASEKAGRAADKAAADKAIADAAAAKAASDVAAAAAKASADAAAAKALTDAAAAKAASDVAAAAAAAKYKSEFNALATKWNKKFPKLKVALKK